MVCGQLHLCWHSAILHQAVGDRPSQDVLLLHSLELGEELAARLLSLLCLRARLSEGVLVLLVLLFVALVAKRTSKTRGTR